MRAGAEVLPTSIIPHQAHGSPNRLVGYNN